MEKNIIDKSLLKWLVWIILALFMLYFTWASSVLWSFWRAVYPWKYSTSWVFDINQFIYWYWYWELWWWYWYWYWYWVNNEYGYYWTVPPTDISSWAWWSSSDPLEEDVIIQSNNWKALIENSWESLYFDDNSKISISTWWFADTSDSDGANWVVTVWWSSVTIGKKVQLDYEWWTSLTMKSTDEDLDWVEVVIPKTTIYAPDWWDWTIIPPRNNASDDTVASAINSASSSNNISSAVLVWSNDYMLLFEDPVKIILDWTYDKLYYVHWWSAHEITTECNDADNPTNIDWFWECYIVLSWKTVIWTKHFTSFVWANQSADDEDSSTSWWSWGWGWYYFNPVSWTQETKEDVEEKIEESVKKWDVVTVFKEALSKITFSTDKYKSIVPMINEIVVGEIVKSQLVSLILSDNSIASDLSNDYIVFVKMLKQYESWSISKSKLKDALDDFIVSYDNFKTDLKNVVSEKKYSIWWKMYAIYKPVFDNSELSQVLEVINVKLVNTLNWWWFTNSQIKDIVSYYNDFVLAVKVMKDVDVSKWRQLAKLYLWKLITKLD